MTRRELIPLLAAALFLPRLPDLDLVMVTTRGGGNTQVWWEPREVAERRLAAFKGLLQND